MEKYRKDKIKRMVMYQPLEYGGINFMHFHTLVKSLRLAWIGRLLGDSDDKWKAIPNFYFHGYGGLSFLLKCNYNVGVLNRDLPLFYRELLQYFQDLKIITNIYPNGEFILWNNKSITVDNTTLFWRSWFEHGVAFVHDVLNADGRFLSFDEFKNNFNIKTNYLYYFQLIAAIPPDLKRRATQNIVPSRDFLSTTITFPNEISINLAEMRCKNYYNLFYGNCFIDPSGIRNWQKKFPEDFVTWKEKFCNIYRFTRDNRLRQFSFRFLHRIIVTKKELIQNRFHIASDDKCALCSTPDSIEHTFIECNVSTKFYLQVLSWFNHYHGTTVELSVKGIAFQNTTPLTDVLSKPLMRRLDLLIILLKQYIYACKCSEKEPILNEFVKKVNVQWKIENCTLP